MRPDTAIADPAYQTELGAYNIEFNVPPRPLPGRTGFELEAEVRASLNAAESKANEDGAHIVMIGILSSVASDAGAEIRDGVKSVNKQGAPPETLWPYVISKFKRKPTPAAFKAALAHQSISYQRVTRDLANMKACLAEGFPYVFGFSVYDGFESNECAKTGVLNVPEKTEELLGGHAVLAVGYDDASQRFIVRNSWGESWGQQGYFTMPYAYMTNRGLCSDFWTIRKVE